MVARTNCGARASGTGEDQRMWASHFGGEDQPTRASHFTGEDHTASASHCLRGDQ